MFTGLLVLSLKCVTTSFFLWTTEESELCEMVALDNDNNQHTFTRLVLVCIKRIWNWVPIKIKKNVCVSNKECTSIILSMLSFCQILDFTKKESLWLVFWLVLLTKPYKKTTLTHKLVPWCHLLQQKQKHACIYKCFHQKEHVTGAIAMDLTIYKVLITPLDVTCFKQINRSKFWIHFRKINPKMGPQRSFQNKFCNKKFLLLTGLFVGDRLWKSNVSITPVTFPYWSFYYDY